MTCAFVPCAEARSCGLPGGCLERRFGRAPTREQQHELRRDARALNGTKPGRASRDPVFVPRKRKAL